MSGLQYPKTPVELMIADDKKHYKKLKKKTSNSCYRQIIANDWASLSHSKKAIYTQQYTHKLANYRDYYDQDYGKTPYFGYGVGQTMTINALNKI
jgi:hypothetical protein